MATRSVFLLAAGTDDTTAAYTGEWPFPAGDTFADHNSAGVIFISKNNLGTDQASVGLVRFQTGPTIPASDRVSEAWLRVNVVNLAGDADNLSLQADYFVWGGAPSVAGDWIETVAASIIGNVDHSALQLDYNNLAITDLAGIAQGSSGGLNGDGWTEIRFAMSAIGTPTGQNEIHFRELAGGPGVELVVVHGPASVEEHDFSRFPKAKLRRAA